MAGAAGALKVEIQNELVEATRLLALIRRELAEIKNLTSYGGALDRQIVQSDGLLKKLGEIRGISLSDLSTLVPSLHLEDMAPDENHSYQQPNTFQNHNGTSK